MRTATAVKAQHGLGCRFVREVAEPEKRMAHFKLPQRWFESLATTAIMSVHGPSVPAPLLYAVKTSVTRRNQSPIAHF